MTNARLALAFFLGFAVATAIISVAVVRSVNRSHAEIITTRSVKTISLSLDDIYDEAMGGER